MYTISISRRAQKELSRLRHEAYERIRDTIRSLAQNPRPPNCRKLSGREGWRIRVGDYRVVYRIDDKEKAIAVLHADHRRSVYRRT